MSHANLRAVRRAYGISQTDLGRRCGVDHSNVCYWETGRHRPSLASGARLTRVFGLPLTDLLSTQPTPAVLALITDAALGRPLPGTREGDASERRPQTFVAHNTEQENPDAV